MNQHKSVNTILAAFFALALTYSAPAAGTLVTQDIEVVSFTGTVTTTAEKPIEAHAHLAPGSSIQTAADSTVTLKLGTLAAVLIKPQSSLTPQLNKSGGWELNLARGAVLSHVHNPSHRDGLYSIRTRTAVMGVRGTSFYSSVDEKNTAFLCACRGTIAVTQGKSPKAVDFTGTNHDQQKQFSGGKTSEAKLAGTHTDEEIATLKQIVGN